jgi:hypothetical protein
MLAYQTFATTTRAKTASVYAKVKFVCNFIKQLIFANAQRLQDALFNSGALNSAYSNNVTTYFIQRKWSNMSTPAVLSSGHAYHLTVLAFT